jgi:hypothetical protein
MTCSRGEVCVCWGGAAEVKAARVGECRRRPSWGVPKRKPYSCSAPAQAASTAPGRPGRGAQVARGGHPPARRWRSRQTAPPTAPGCWDSPCCSPARSPARLQGAARVARGGGAVSRGALGRGTACKQSLGRGQAVGWGQRAGRAQRGGAPNSERDELETVNWPACWPGNTLPRGMYFSPVTWSCSTAGKAEKRHGSAGGSRRPWPAPLRVAGGAGGGRRRQQAGCRRRPPPHAAACSRCPPACSCRPRTSPSPSPAASPPTRVPVAEGAALHVLPAQPHMVALGQQRGERQRLGGGPVHALACSGAGEEGWVGER